MTTTMWMTYDEYVYNTIWYQLKSQFVPNKLLISIIEECSAAKFSKEVLDKYQLTI
jgi:hypothetical protein